MPRSPSEAWRPSASVTLAPDVAALGDVPRVAEAVHQLRPGARDAGGIPTDLAGLVGQAVAGQGREHEVERGRLWLSRMAPRGRLFPAGPPGVQTAASSVAPGQRGWAVARRSIVGIVPIAALAVTTGCWPQAGFNAAGTNHNTWETALTVDSVAALAPAWSAPGHTTAVVGDVYAVSASGWAFPDQAWARASALDASDGHPVWTTTLSSPGATDAVAGGSAVVGDQLWVTWGELRCPKSGECTSLARGARLDRRTGAVLGVTPPGPDLVPFGNLVASIRTCSPETCSSPLTVVDADTGDLAWRPAAGLLDVSTGATVAGGMLYATAGTRIHAFAA